MWLASEMAAFAQVCELKSFTAAARSLGVPKVAVSRAIASLERRLGSRLLTRTTRRVALTSAGTLLLPHCQRLQAEVAAVRARFAAAPGTQRLRVIVDSGYGRLLVTPLVPRFLEHHPDFELQVTSVESLPATASDEWDLLICNGAPQDPTLTLTPLGTPAQLLCATTAYLGRHGLPKIPVELATHTVLRAVEIGTAAAPGAGVLRLTRGAEQADIRLKPGLQVSDPTLVHSSMAAGLGIGVLPEFMCRQGLAMGRLQRILPDWSVSATLLLNAVHASHADSSTAIRQFLEFLLANMAPVLGGAP